MNDRFDLKNEGDLYTDADRYYARSVLSKTPSARRLKKEDRDATQLGARRGMGKTGRTTRVVTDAERMTICMLRGKGLTESEIGEKLKRTQGTINQILKKAESDAKAAGLNYDWRADLQEKSVAAIRTALIDGGDVYKGGGLGVQTLKGLGVFEQEGSVNVNQLIAAIPEDLRSRYVRLEEPPSLPEKTEGEDHGSTQQ